MRTFPASRVARPLRLGLLAAGFSVIAVGVPSLAVDRFMAGERATRSVGLSDAQRAVALERADRLARALGLPAAGRRDVARLDDRFEAGVFDEVTFHDERDRPIAIARFHADGRLRHLVRLGWYDAGLAPAPASTIPGRARAIAGAAGLASDGEPIVEPDRGGAGWVATWPRMAGGVPVPGDGAWLRLWPDGSLHAVALVESRLSPAPASTLAETDARRIAERQLDARVAGSARGEIALASARLAWVAPNDLFEPARPDAPDPVLRLAWVVRASTVGALSERLRALELYLDAGDGTLLGGDTLE